MKTSIAFLLAVATLACGGSPGAFDVHFPDNRPAQIDTVLSQISRQGPRVDPPVVVGLTSDPAHLFVYDLRRSSMLWRAPVSSRTIPHVAGSVIVTQEEEGVVARDLWTGAVRFRAEDGALHLVGADGDGSVSAVVLSTGGGVGAHSRILLATEGAVDHDFEVDHAMGMPAVLGGLAFLPWGSQNMSVLDVRSGTEVARVRLLDEVVGSARVSGEQVYFGQRSAFRFDRNIAEGTRSAASSLTPSVGELPGRPGLVVDAYRPPLHPESALHRVRLEWAPAGEGNDFRFADNNLYLVFYRLIFALSPETGEVRWAHAHEEDVVGATAVQGGLFIVDARGQIAFARAGDGAVANGPALGTNVMVAALRAAAADPPTTSTGTPPPLVDQLLAVAQDTDARLVPGQLFAVERMTALEQPEATSRLISLCDGRDYPGTVRVAACTAVASRDVGAAAVVTALERHAGFLEGTTAPPVGALARAAARMEESRAVPLLIAHLKDPDTASADLAPLLVALGALGDNSAAQPVHDFIRTYHADPVDEDVVRGLEAAIQALLALQGPVAREAFEEVVADPMSIPVARERSQQALFDLETAAREASEAEAAEEEDGEDDTEGESTRPRRVTLAMVEQLLMPVRSQMLACLSAAPTHPRTARIILRLDGEGQIERVSIAPANLRSCLEPLVRSQQYPANERGASEQFIYTLRH